MGARDLLGVLAIFGAVLLVVIGVLTISAAASLVMVCR